jgi:hypothetical protein
MLVTAHQLAAQVKLLRDMQKLYFKNKDIVILQRCKFHEKELDKMVESILENQKPQQPTLFQ